MTIANYITYFILIICLVLSIYKPKTAFLLLVATQFTRISNIMGMPRLFSPLFIEFVLLVIIYFSLRKQINFLTIVKHTKLLYIWVGSHMVWRLFHFLIYDDIAFITFSSDIINFYFKIMIFYLILINYYSTGNDFNMLTKCLSLNLLFLVSFVYLEYFFGIQYGVIFSSIIPSGDWQIERFFQRLLMGPFQHWTLTGMVLVTSLPLLFYRFNERAYKTAFYTVLLFIAIVLVGIRAASVSAILVISIFLATRFNYKKGIIILVILIMTPFLLKSFAGIFHYYQQSFAFSVTAKSEGFNLTSRLFNTYLLVSNINTVPFLGYGWRIRDYMSSKVNMPVASHDMESNLFIKDIYDFGIIIGCITIIWFISNILTGIKQQKKYNYVSTLTWLSLFIAAMSNITFTFPVFIVPLAFYSWEKCKLLQKKVLPKVSIPKTIN